MADTIGSIRDWWEVDGIKKIFDVTSLTLFYQSGCWRLLVAPRS